MDGPDRPPRLSTGVQQRIRNFPTISPFRSSPWVQNSAPAALYERSVSFITLAVNLEKGERMVTAMASPSSLHMDFTAMYTKSVRFTGYSAKVSPRRLAFLGRPLRESSGGILQSYRSRIDHRLSSSPRPLTVVGTLADGIKTIDTVHNIDEQLDMMTPEFYRMGYIRHVRAYGVEFKEGPMGIGVYAAKDIPHLNKARVIMEIPLELMITVSRELPWMFHPDFVPVDHPIFEIINSTHPETDWDFRLACLLLLALDQNEHFWQLYSDYLPGNEDITSMLLATEDELRELHNDNLAEAIARQKKRVIDAWSQYWPADSVLKLKRLARDADQFLWALGVVWSRKFMMKITIGAKTQEAHMLIPYADMLNHSFQPTCSFRWRRRDRMLEVVMNAGQCIKKGDEMTINYIDCKPNDTYMLLYGFSSPKNPWDTVKFSGNSKIHLDSFLSAFNLAGMIDELYYNEASAEEPDMFVDGAVIAAARMLPTWSDGDLPFLPSLEIKAAKALQLECLQHLRGFPTTLEEDRVLFEYEAEKRSPRWQAAIRYRMNRKIFLQKIVDTLDLYMERILF